MCAVFISIKIERELSFGKNTTDGHFTIFVTTLLNRELESCVLHLAVLAEVAQPGRAPVGKIAFFLGEAEDRAVVCSSHTLGTVTYVYKFSIGKALKL